MKPFLVALLLAVAGDKPGIAADAPLALSVRCHDAVRWVRMNKPDPKNPGAALVRSTDKQYDIAINGLIANTTDLPDVKAWRLDHEIRARQEAGDESYWKGRNPNKAKKD